MTVKKKLINHLYSADTLQHILLKDANRRVMLKKKNIQVFRRDDCQQES